MGCHQSSLQRARQYERLHDDVVRRRSYDEDVDIESVESTYATFATELGGCIERVRAAHMRSLREKMADVVIDASYKDKCYNGATTLDFGVIFAFPSMFSGVNDLS